MTLVFPTPSVFAPDVRLITFAVATDTEKARWSLGDTVTLRGLDEPTRLAVPV